MPMTGFTEQLRYILSVADRIDCSAYAIIDSHIGSPIIRWKR